MSRLNRLIFSKPMMRAGTMALAATMFCAMPVVAQDNSAPPPPAQQQDNTAPAPGGHMRHMDHGRHMERMTKALNLSADQESQIKAIHEDERKQAMAVRDDSTLAKADKRAKMMDIHKASQDKIRGVLNDEQKTKYDAMQAKMRERRAARVGGDSAPPQPPAAAPQQ